MRYEDLRKLEIALRNYLQETFNLTFEQAELEALRILKGIRSEGFEILKKREIE